jgi:hypothetical protein
LILKACSAGFDSLSYAATVRHNYRYAHGHRFNAHDPKRLKRRGVTECVTSGKHFRYVATHAQKSDNVLYPEVTGQRLQLSPLITVAANDESDIRAARPSFGDCTNGNIHTLVHASTERAHRRENCGRSGKFPGAAKTRVTSRPEPVHIHAVVKYDQPLPRNAVRAPHPISKCTAAHDDTVGAVLADKVRRPEFPGIEIQVALLEANPQRDSGPPRTVKAQESTPGQMGLHQTWAVLAKYAFQLVGGGREAPLCKTLPEIEHINWNTELPDLIPNRTISKKADHSVSERIVR